MSKKTLILTQEQIDEINGGAGFFEYLDGMSDNPDMGDVFTKEVSTDGGNEVNSNYPETPTTGDDIADTLTIPSRTRDYLGYGKTCGLNNLNYLGTITTEMTKREWGKKNLISERNKALDGRSFGDKTGDDISNGKPKGITNSQGTQAKYRRRVAAKQALNGSTEAERQKGRESYARMMQNPNYNDALNQLETARNAANIMQSMKPEGEKIESKPKPGVGTAHSPKSQKVEGGYII